MSFPSMIRQVIVALDVDLADQKIQKEWLDRFDEAPIAGIKIGLQGFISGGPDLVRRAVDQGAQVFLDLKLHDIPHTVQRAARMAAQLGVWMLTVHTAGGGEMLRAARQGLQEGKKGKGKGPMLLGVTVLTSQDASPKEVLSRAELAKDNGCDGVVASAHEVQELRRTFGKDFVLVTPGIRLAAAQSVQKEDQKRVATPQEALAWGSDYLVLGRPVLEAKDPVAFLRSLGKGSP